MLHLVLMKHNSSFGITSLINDTADVLLVHVPVITVLEIVGPVIFVGFGRTAVVNLPDISTYGLWVSIIS